MRSVRTLFHKVRSTRRARPERVEEYLARCRELVQRAEATLRVLIAQGANAWHIEVIEGYLSHAIRQIDQVDRRLLRGEVIPQHEKVFSIFEPHTRWIAKGKAECPVELGVPVCILEDQHGFILHHEVMWQGNSVPTVTGTHGRDLPGAVFRSPRSELRPRLSQPREPNPPRRTARSQRAAEERLPEQD